tara:strand:+ start:873 stop:1244 length:372 start_codon:yes stop_codon:yes gene_type:complete
MGYFGLAHYTESDNATDLNLDITNAIVHAMSDYMEQEYDDGFNTAPIVDVVLNLISIMSGTNEYWLSDDDFYHFTESVIVQLKRYIEKAKDEKWDDEGNRDWHVKSYEKLLRDLESLIKNCNL